MIVIVGGGLAGLSCAYHLGETPHALYEAEARPGGLCRSRVISGYTFDSTGHLLHLRDPSVARLILDELCPGVFRKHRRNAFVYSHRKLTPYPFQANTYGLPRPVVRDCVVGFVRAPRIDNPVNFREWALTTFGTGIYEHFLRPYNEKLWRVSMEELTHEWCRWSVPRPALEQIVDGAIGNVQRNMGYNPAFYYPRHGGIEVLPQAFAVRCRSLEVNHRATHIDVRRRVVHFENGREAPYTRLVSSIPLDELLAMATGGPEEWREISRRLRRVPVLCLNLGFEGRFLGRTHWVYVPEARFPFYRIGVASNIEPSLAPAGCANLYVEVSLPSIREETEPIVRACLDSLAELGLSRPPAVLETLLIPCAYIVYDRFRDGVVPAVLQQLRDHGILSTGRYGSWTYSSMEEAILDGRKAAAWAIES